MKGQQTAKSLRELTETELTQKFRENSDASFKLKMQHALKQLANPLKIRLARREKARLITILKEKKELVKTAK